MPWRPDNPPFEPDAERNVNACDPPVYCHVWFFASALGGLYQERALRSDVVECDRARPHSTAKSAQIALDTTIPTGSIVINGGATYANKIAVTLSLTCSAPRGSSGCSQMQFSNDGSTWSAPQSYATTAAWTLTTGDGTKSVSACFVNGAGTVSAVYTAQITLDATLPTGARSSSTTMPQPRSRDR